MLAAVAVDPHPWRFQAHPEVWALVVGLGVLYWWAMTRVGPKACLPGETVVTRTQVRWFVAGLLVLWLASDWPMHDIAEEYLYSAHMVQHLLLSLVVCPMLLLGTPTWLARLVVGGGGPYRVVHALSRIIPVTILFNAVVLLSHWPWVVDHIVSYGWLHYGIHVLVVVSALLLWTPICGPFPELRYSYPMQIVLLFLQSIVPTLPAGWLTFADGIVYHSYDVTPRVFGLSLAYDQQAAGAIMKLVGGMYLWTIIAILFFKWARAESDRVGGGPLDRRAPVAP